MCFRLLSQTLGDSYAPRAVAEDPEYSPEFPTERRQSSAGPNKIMGEKNRPKNQRAERKDASEGDRDRVVHIK